MRSRVARPTSPEGFVATSSPKPLRDFFLRRYATTAFRQGYAPKRLDANLGENLSWRRRGTNRSSLGCESKDHGRAVVATKVFAQFCVSRKRSAFQRQNTSEVARGDEAAVNARIGRFRAVGPWVFAALLIIGGCAVTRTVYVKEQDRVTALRPGETYSNATEAVEWVVPRTVMTQLVIANEGLK